MRVVLGDGVDEVWRDGHRSIGLSACETLIVPVDVEEQRPFLTVPPVVAAIDDDVDLLDVVLADVADEEPARLRVERKPERVSEAKGKDLLNDTGPSDKRITGGYSILTVGRVPAVHVDPKDLSMRRVQPLRVPVALMPNLRGLLAGRVVRRRRHKELAVLIVRTAAVAHRDVEHSIGSERELAAVMVPLRPVDAHELSAAAGGDDRRWVSRI